MESPAAKPGQTCAEDDRVGLSASLISL